MMGDAARPGTARGAWRAVCQVCFLQGADHAMPIYRIIDSRLGRARLRQWRNRALAFLGLLAGMIVVFAAGLAMLAGSGEAPSARFFTGLWNAVNLVTTLGDFTRFNPEQRVFMLFGMLAAMLFGAFAINQLTGILSSDAVLVYRENRAMERELKQLSGHTVVIGFVGLGRRVAQDLRAAGRQVVVIDKDDMHASDAAGLGFMVIHGDAGIDDTVLHRANIATAAELYVTTADPSRNLVITLMSHTLNAGLQIAVMGDNARWGEMFRRAGATRVVIADELLSAAMIDAAGAAPAAVCH
ncbi:potassium channel family protein [Crenobacter intestini]|nr:NAD(P)-binding protein [Crenobacter intestini]